MSRRAAIREWGGAGLVLSAMALGIGGAAAAPRGLWLGVPTASTWLWLLGALAVATAFGCRFGAAWGLAALALLYGLAASAPGVRALSGPPVQALAWGALVLGLGSRRWRGAWLFLPVCIVVYGWAAWRVQHAVGPEGDEPHYLMVADSLWRDGDLALERDYAEGRYRSFHPNDLEPHYRVRGRGGAIYSLHAVGLSILVLPAYLLGGYTGASFFMAALLVLLALEIRGLLDGMAGEGRDGAAWAVALSPPLVHYAGLIFTEVPAALIAAFVLRRGFSGVATRRRALVLGTALAVLPWLNVRYALLAVILLAFLLAARPQAGWLLAPLALSAAGLGLYHYLLYGFFDPRRVYGARPELSLANLGHGLPGLFFDQEFGLLPYAPLFCLAMPGWLAVLRRNRRLALTVLAAVVGVSVTAGSWPMWRGGFNPPGRFLLPLVPFLATALAARWRQGLSAAAALLVGWGLFTGLTGAAAPQLVHRDRDGTAPLFRVASGACEWTRLLPGYVLDEPGATSVWRGRAALTLLWAAALGVAVAARPRPIVKAWQLAAAIVILAGFAHVAALAGPTGAPERDAVRLVGRTAVAVPGLQAAEAVAAWSAADLDWGPLYEPHRHPEGAPIARRLSLPPGRYRLTLRTEPLSPAVPGLVLSPEGARSRPRSLPLLAGPESYVADLVILAGERAESLSLLGGGPFVLKGVSLRAQPFSRADDPNPVDVDANATLVR